MRGSDPSRRPIASVIRVPPRGACPYRTDDCIFHPMAAGTPRRGALTTRCATGPTGTAFAVALTVQPADAEGIPSADEIAARERFVEEWRARGTTICVPRNRRPKRCCIATFATARRFHCSTAPATNGSRSRRVSRVSGVLRARRADRRWQAAMVDRGEALDAALTKLGRLQSARVDDWHDEQPGRIPYQVGAVRSRSST